MTLVHRFTSPEWYQTLKRHISIANAESDSEDNRELFEKIVRLNTGEGYIFAPSALVDRLDGVERLGGGLMKIKIRKRTTWDVCTPAKSHANAN